MAHIEALFGYLTNIYATTLPNVWQFSIRSLVSFLLVGPLLWAIFEGGSRLPSLRKLPGILFPAKYYRDPTARITHWNFVLMILFWGPLFTLISFNTYKLSESVTNVLTGWFGAQAPLFDASWAIVTIQVTAFLLFIGLADYITHVALHKVPVLWSIHRAHHSVEALTLPAMTRNHPLEFVVNAVGISFGAGFGAGCLLYAVGLGTVTDATLAITVGFVGWRAILDVFAHSHIPVSFGWLDRIFGGPVLHQFHHSAEPRHRDKNFGGFFPFSMWDWIFGTLYLPKKGEQYRWGLNEVELGANNPHLTLRDYYLEPFRHAWAVIKRRRWNPEMDFAVPVD